MENKLKVLTEKLFKEGIEKGQKEADGITSSAKEESQKILNSAREEAKKIVENAIKEASEKKKKVDAELKLAALQSISTLKNNISNLLSLKITDRNVSETINEKEFVQKMILTLLESWAKDKAETFDLKIYLPKIDKTDLSGFIKKNCKSIFDKGVELEVTDDLKSGFRVGPKDSSYVVDFNEESFKSFFKEFLKPATRELIF